MPETQTLAHTGFQVNAKDPCPACGKPDWCFWLTDLKNYVACKRQSMADLPDQDGWRAIKTTGDSVVFTTEAQERTQHLSAVSDETAFALMPPVTLPPKHRGIYSRTIKGQLYTGEGLETVYLYGAKQRVVRIDWSKSAEAGETKTILPEYQNGIPEWRMGLGDDRTEWHPYQLEEIALYGHGKFVSWAEGEKCVDALRLCGLPATTIVGSLASNQEANNRTAVALKSVGITGVYYWLDNDKPGLEKAKRAWEACRDLGLFFVLVDLAPHWSELPDGGDVADYIAAGLHQHQSIQLIQTHLRGIVAASCGKPLPAEWAEPGAIAHPDDEKRYNLLRQAIEDRYLPLDSLIKRTMVADQLATTFKVRNVLIRKIAEQIQDEQDGISSQEEAVQSRGLTRANVIPPGTLQSSAGAEFQIQGFLKQGSSMMLCALPKAGKSLLMYQIARSLVYGEDFLQCHVPKPQKVMIIQAEEAQADWQEHLAAFGLHQAIEQGNLILVTQFDVMNDLRRLTYEIEKEGIQVVLTDSITAISMENPASENDMEYSRPIARMNNAINRLGASHIAIHHSNKGALGGVGKSRGTTALPGTFATVMQLDRVDDFNPTRTERRLSGGGRGSVVIDWTIDLSVGDGEIEWLFVSAKGKGAEERSMYDDRILGVLGECPFPLSTGELMDRLSLSHDTKAKPGFFASLKGLRESGQIAYDEIPGHRVGKPQRIYRLPGKLTAPMPAQPAERPEPVVDAAPKAGVFASTATGTKDIDGAEVEVGREYALFFYGDAWDYSKLSHLHHKRVRVEKLDKHKGALVNVGSMHWIPCRYLTPDLPEDTD